MASTDTEFAIEQARQLHRAGRLAEAEQIHHQVLAADPNHVEALNLAGAVALQTGRVQAGQALLARAVSLCPERADLHNNLAMAWLQLGRIPEAIWECNEAMRLRDHYAEPAFTLGLALVAQKDYEAAVAAFGNVIALRPNWAEAHANLSTALAEQNQVDQAIDAAARAVQLKPDFAEAWFNLGNLLMRRVKAAAALDAYASAIRLRPQWAEARNNLGTALMHLNRPDEAAIFFQEAIRLNPGFAKAFNNLGNAHRDQGLLDSAIDCYRSAMALKPDDAAMHSNCIAALHYHPDAGPQDILAEQARWEQRHGRPVVTCADIPCGIHTSGARKLRVGYVSPDFRDHVVGRNILPLLREHDRSKIEVFCYADVRGQDAMTSTFRALPLEWRDITAQSDDRAAARIGEDGIDILVDLALHTAGNRLPIFARKPAPAQVTFAGYPAGTGLHAIDYRLTDRYLDPPEEQDAHYVERSIRLDGCFWCYDRQAMELDQAPPVSPLPARGGGHITFGCLGHVVKINRRVIALWAQVLHYTPLSKMLLLVGPDSVRQRIRQDFLALGIDPARIEFVGFLPRLKYLESCQRIDIGLDTTPYNGHTTSLDAMWMGVPVITLIGRTSVGRAGWSQLNFIGVPELAACDEHQFVHIATHLASDLPRLNQLRMSMRDRMLASRIMDAKGFARSVEDAYECIRASAVGALS